MSIPAAPLALLPLDALHEQEFAEVEVMLGGELESLVLLRHGEVVRAWLNLCPHAGRRLDWAPGQFLKSKEGHLVCAAHGATFDAEHGECIAGPCRGASLRAVAVRVVDGVVLLDA